MRRESQTMISFSGLILFLLAISELEQQASGTDDTCALDNQGAAHVGTQMLQVARQSSKPQAGANSSLPCSVSALPPSRCPQRNDRFPVADLRAALPDFAKVYANRPIKVNWNGVSVNHAFAMWYTARSLKPSAVVESGIYAGQGTWLIRQAVGPGVPIFSIDPEDPSKKEIHWKDVSGNTTYFTASKFKDFSKLPWTTYIPDAKTRADTLVVLDDHTASTKRVKDMLGFGFHKLWYDDNWRDMDCYSFNMVCAPPPPGTSMTYKVGYAGGELDHVMSEEEHESKVKYLTSRLETYFEFPPILDICNTGRPTLLASGTPESMDVELEKLGLPKLGEDNFGYQSLFPPFVELVPDATA